MKANTDFNDLLSSDVFDYWQKTFLSNFLDFNLDKNLVSAKSQIFVGERLLYSPGDPLKPAHVAHKDPGLFELSGEMLFLSDFRFFVLFNCVLAYCLVEEISSLRQQIFSNVFTSSFFEQNAWEKKISKLFTGTLFSGTRDSFFNNKAFCSFFAELSNCKQTESAQLEVYFSLDQLKTFVKHSFLTSCATIMRSLFSDIADGQQVLIRNSSSLSRIDADLEVNLLVQNILASEVNVLSIILKDNLQFAEDVFDRFWLSFWEYTEDKRDFQVEIFENTPNLSRVPNFFYKESFFSRVSKNYAKIPSEIFGKEVSTFAKLRWDIRNPSTIEEKDFREQSALLDVCWLKKSSAKNSLFWYILLKFNVALDAYIESQYPEFRGSSIVANTYS